MSFSGKAVPYRHAGVFGKRLDDLLAVATVLDAVEHAAQNARGILNGFLVAHLRPCRVKVGYAHAQVVTGNLKGATGARRGLLEQKDDVLALELFMKHTRMLLFLQLLSKVD